MTIKFSYVSLMALAVIAFPSIGQNQGQAYAQVPTCAPEGTIVAGPIPACPKTQAQALSITDQARQLQGVAAPEASRTPSGAPATTQYEVSPKLGTTYNEYVKNYNTWKNGLSVTDLIRGAELGNTTAPMSEAAWKQQYKSETQAAAEGIVLGPYPATTTKTVSSVSSTGTPVTENQYNLLVQNNKAAYEALKAKVNNVPTLIATGQCAPAGSIVAGPVPACPTNADLTKLLNKNQAEEANLKSQIVTTGTSTSSSGTTCAPAGTIVAGPIPACPTTQANTQPVQAVQTATTTGNVSQAEYNKVVEQNKAAYDALKAQVSNVPAMIAAKQCAPAGTIVAGPIPACPTNNDLLKLLNKNQAQEAALKAQLATTTVASQTPVTTGTVTEAQYNSVVAQNKAAYDALKAKIDNVPALIASKQCAPAGTIVAGPIPACPTIADLEKLALKNQTQEAALKSQLVVPAVSSAVAALQTQYNDLVAKNKAAYDALKAQITNTPALIASKQCAPAGTIVAGPIPACPTDNDLLKLLSNNQAQETALKSQIAAVASTATSATIGTTVNVNTAEMAAATATLKCAPAGTIVAGPIPACPTAAASATKTASSEPTWATQ